MINNPEISHHEQQQQQQLRPPKDLEIDPSTEDRIPPSPAMRAAGWRRLGHWDLGELAGSSQPRSLYPISN